MSEAPGAADFRAAATTLAEQLAKGWSKGRVDLIIGVFHPEAIFLETPFGKPMQGHDAIRRWAADIPYHQSEARFTIGEVFTVGPWFSAEFRLVFRRRKTGQWVDARGALFAETTDGSISELRMYWHRMDGGRETSPP
jgi:hypothetical protein